MQFAVVGAGAGGSAAAREIAARQGQVVLLDQREHAGGRFASADLPTDVSFFGGTFVWGLFKDGVIACARHGRSLLLRAERIVLATGARAALAAFPGWESASVWSLSRLWRRIEGGEVAGLRLAVYAGVPEVLPAVDAAKRAGVGAVAVVGPCGERPQAHPVGAWQGGGELQVQWSDGVQTVCDVLVVASGHAQRSELARQAGCALAFSESAGDWLVSTDDLFQTSLPEIFFVPAGPAEAAIGAIAGLGAHRALFPHGETAFLRDLDPLRAALAEAGGALTAECGPAWFTPPPVLCPCEGVLADRAATAGAGLREMNRWKRATRIGAGTCQGRFCRRVAASFLAQQTGLALSEIPPSSCRPPIWPLPLASIAAIRQPLDL